MNNNSKLSAEEKANELIEKFKEEIWHSDLNVCHTDDLDKETAYLAKQCAMVCCKEVILSLEALGGGVLSSGGRGIGKSFLLTALKEAIWEEKEVLKHLESNKT